MATAFKTGLALCDPVVGGQLGFRLGLVRRRTAAYPMDSLDFIMMDLERPDGCTRHAHWCTGDLTGRMLEFLAASDGVDGHRDERLVRLFERILLQRRPNGFFGRFVGPDHERAEPGQDPTCLGARLFCGLVRYYEVTRDQRALDWAVTVSDEVLKRRDEFLSKAQARFPPWIAEPGANLYRITGDARHLELCRITDELMRRADARIHTHGFLAALRGLQLAALHTADLSWNELPERYRKMVLERRYEMPDGCVTEAMRPNNYRNEGCAIADWMLLNLYSAALSADPARYEEVEKILWNALFFNQFVTGGFGHRDVLPHGYGMAISEAWWCCTEHAGTAMSDLARHVVTRRDKTASVNLLMPGTFTVPAADGPEIEVRVATDYPGQADTVVAVERLPRDMRVEILVPSCIRGADLRQERQGEGLRITLTGRMGYRLAEAGEYVVLKYGPLVLAPMAYYWKAGADRNDETIPQGYLPPSLPAGLPELLVGPTDADGFVSLRHDPIPSWTYFDEGPAARCAVGTRGISVNVPVRFPDGREKTLRFWPLCYITSNVSYYETPIQFPRRRPAT